MHLSSLSAAQQLQRPVFCACTCLFAGFYSKKQNIDGSRQIIHDREEAHQYTGTGRATFANTSIDACSKIYMRCEFKFNKERFGGGQRHLEPFSSTVILLCDCMTTYMRRVLQKCTSRYEASHILLVVESHQHSLQLLLLLGTPDQRMRVPGRHVHQMPLSDISAPRTSKPDHVQECERVCTLQLA